MKHDTIIIHEDEYLLVVNKPTGLLSAPDRYDPFAPVASHELEEAHGRLWPVHVLDPEASGVLVFARSEDSYRALAAAFESGQVRSVYRTVVCGRPAWKETVCELPLLTDGDRKHRTIIDGSGKPAVTEFTVLGSRGPLAIIEASLFFGRTHQVRVHLAALGFSIACDPLYGDGEPVFLSKVKRKWKGDPLTERPLMTRTALHALAIELPHPDNGMKERYEAAYPKDFRALMTQLEKN